MAMPQRIPTLVDDRGHAEHVKAADDGDDDAAVSDDEADSDDN